MESGEDELADSEEREVSSESNIEDDLNKVSDDEMMEKHPLLVIQFHDTTNPILYHSRAWTGTEASGENDSKDRADD